MLREIKELLFFRKDTTEEKDKPFQKENNRFILTSIPRANVDRCVDQESLRLTLVPCKADAIREPSESQVLANDHGICPVHLHLIICPSRFYISLVILHLEFLYAYESLIQLIALSGSCQNFFIEVYLLLILHSILLI